MKSCKKNRQPSDVNFTHARNFPFIFNVKLHACAKIDVEIFYKTSVFAGLDSGLDWTLDSGLDSGLDSWATPKAGASL